MCRPVEHFVRLSRQKPCICEAMSVGATVGSMYSFCLRSEEIPVTHVTTIERSLQTGQAYHN